jgi:hypothetical protein
MPFLIGLKLGARRDAGVDIQQLVQEIWDEHGLNLPTPKSE